MTIVRTLSHPLARVFLKDLRDKSSTPDTFRQQVKRLSHMLALECSQDIKTKSIMCTTPLCETEESEIAETIALVPILRAGIGMVEPFLDFLPNAQVHCLGLYRDEETHKPVSYYNKLPQDTPPDTAYIIDPMLATGGSALATIDVIKAWGVKNIKFVGLIGAPEGIKAVHDKHPEIDILLASLDSHLNENAYIVPGLGDAGDRLFNS